jgi:hypothetical protein
MERLATPFAPKWYLFAAFEVKPGPPGSATSPTFRAFPEISEMAATRRVGLAQLGISMHATGYDSGFHLV